MVKRAIITGITGQDGSYLADLLLSKGYKVCGIIRDTAFCDFERIQHIRDRITLKKGNLSDKKELIRIIEEYQPNEFYNFAAPSFIPDSWFDPIATTDLIALSVVRILEAIREVDLNIKFYQATSSEIFGRAREVPQNEMTPFDPSTPYGVSKLYGHFMTVNYREAYGVFAVSGILYNHESPRRPLRFVTRKITNTVAKIKLGIVKELKIGNLDAKRDWGFAGDYVRAIWMMLQQKEPEDFVIATGKLHSVQDVVEVAFSHVGLDWRNFTVTDPKFVRSFDVGRLVGNPDKAKAKLGWKPDVSFEDLIKMMVDADMAQLSS